MFSTARCSFQLIRLINNSLPLFNPYVVIEVIYSVKPLTKQSTWVQVLCLTNNFLAFHKSRMLREPD